MFELTEDKMVSIIDDFFTNYYPKFARRMPEV